MPPHLPRVVLLAACLGGSVCLAGEPAAAHVLSGAKAFRAGDWPTALVEFRVALKLGAPPSVRWYEGATLARAGRFEEAVGAFQLAQEQAPNDRDPLLDYYRALACFEARLWGCVVEVTDELQRTGGPRVQQQVSQMSREAKQLLATEPPKEAIDACFSRAKSATDPGVARAWWLEAARLGRKRADAWRVPEAEAASAPKVK